METDENAESAEKSHDAFGTYPRSPSNEKLLDPPEKIVDNLSTPPPNENKHHYYNAKKPRWWKRLAGRRGTPAQRKAISLITQKGYVIPKLKKHQHEIDVSKLFEGPPKGIPISLDDIIVRKDGENNGGSRPANDMHLILEIGFGLGDNIMTNATKFPKQKYIGAEIHQPGVGVACMRMAKAIEAGTYWMEQTWFKESDFLEVQKRLENQIDTSIKPYDNLRIYPGDGVKLLSYLPDNSMDSIYLTFPDPWPQDDQHQWRVIQEETVGVIGRVLKPRGCFYLATDSIIVDEWSRKIFTTVQGHSHEEESIKILDWEELSPSPDRILWLPAINNTRRRG